MLRKLLRKNINIPQLAGYAMAALVGMSIIFAAFCFSMDIRPLFSPAEGLFKAEYMVVNKKVPVMAAFRSNRTAFSPAEIEELRQQPFVRSLSYFTPSRFQVEAYTEPSPQAPSFSTDLFFESVPDRLLDVNTADWQWDEQSGLIPIIIPRDYLNLYNFGFAGSQGLPQISEDIMRQVVFHIEITGGGRRGDFKGRIVGFSDYLNTILVPEAFMDWANQHYGNATGGEHISRLILEVTNPAAPEIAAFFAGKQNYEISNNKQGQLSYFLTLVITIVMAVGGLIMLLAIGLMLLSINLLIYKNQKTLGNLVLLGYRRSKLAQPYCVLTLVLNIAVGLVGLLIARYVQSIYIPKLSALGTQNTASGFWLTAAFAICFVLLITALDVLWIQHKIRKIDIPKRG